MPAIFFGHGSPMNALEQNRYTRIWRQLGASLPRPRAILAVSAHWTTRGTAVTAMDRPRTIHDFGGFPPELYEVRYPAPGDPALARQVRTLLSPQAVHLDHHWGLDHGSWSVLVHAFPEADVPVVQLSLDTALPAQDHYRLAARLAALREQGVLIIGSGNVVHHLGRIQWSPDARPHDWAVRFNAQVRTRLAAGEHQPLIDYESAGADARLSIPTPEHYLPLMYVIAQQAAGEPLTLPVDGIEFGSISMLAVMIGQPPVTGASSSLKNELLGDAGMRRGEAS